MSFSTNPFIKEHVTDIDFSGIDYPARRRSYAYAVTMPENML